MQKLLFIGHEYHQKTQSHAFLLDLLKPRYDITCLFLQPPVQPDDPGLAGFAGTRFDAVVWWQVAPPAGSGAHLPAGPAVFFPMYDQSGRWPLEAWLPLRGLRIISFSRSLARRLSRWGFDVHHFQYFPDPGGEPPAGDPARAFFWNRTSRIHLPMVAALLSGGGIRTLHVHKAMDPGESFRPLPETPAPALDLAWSTWFGDRAELRARILESAVYVAPRLYEGIGMSFLEAMAQGRCVVAPDRPTMNEYISHGRTGLLYNPRRPAPLDLGDLAGIQRRARDYMVAGWERWQREREGILPLLGTPARRPGARLWLAVALRYLVHPLQVSRTPRRWLLSVRVNRREWRVRICGRTWSGTRGQAG